MMAPTEEFRIREGLIHRSTWKRNSRKFAVASDPPCTAVSTLHGHVATPSASKRPDQVAFVAPSCSKMLRVVTSLLPEKSPPIGPGPTELRPNGVLRSWHQK